MKINPVVYRLSVVLVSIYLSAVGLWLLATRQIPNPNLGKLVRAYMRKPYATELSKFDSNGGHCWLADVPEYIPSDDGSISPLALFEDGKPLGPAHRYHDEIRELGEGRYSHWGVNLYFSTSDNSDPSHNGRRYTVKEIR